MHLSDKDLNIISNKDSNRFGLTKRFNFQGKNTTDLYRVDLLKRMVEAKNVIHFGCTDHYENIDNKIKNNTFLHTTLVSSANRCAGVDIQEDALNHLRNNYNIQDLYCWDILSSPPPDELKASHWDYLLLPEMLEHVDSPIAFLSQLRNQFSGIADNVLITVPSAIRSKNFLFSLKKAEHVNADHRYYFSPVTLARCMVQAGIEPGEFYFCNYGMWTENLIERVMSKYVPSSRDSLVMLGKLNVKK